MYDATTPAVGHSPDCNNSPVCWKSSATSLIAAKENSARCFAETLLESYLASIGPHGENIRPMGGQVRDPRLPILLASRDQQTVRVLRFRMADSRQGVQPNLHKPRISSLASFELLSI